MKLRAKGLKTIAVSAHPGYTRTNLQYAGISDYGWCGRMVMKVANALGGQDTEMGAAPLLWAATDDDAGRNQYYGPGWFAEMWGWPTRNGVIRRHCASDGNAEKLWDMSEELTKYHYDL